MMKKYLIVLLAVGMLTGIAACGTDNKSETDATNGQVATVSSVDESSDVESSLDESAADILDGEAFTVTLDEDEAGAFAP